MTTMTAKVVGPRDGKAGFLGSIGVRFMIDGEDAHGGFSLVEHPMSGRALAAPLHRHTHEDEYSYVLEGRIGALSRAHTLLALSRDPCDGAATVSMYTAPVNQSRGPALVVRAFLVICMVFLLRNGQRSSRQGRACSVLAGER